VEQQDVGVLQRGGGADLGEEPAGSDDSGELWLQHLERDPAAVLEVLGQVDRGHPAFTELTLNAVSTVERGLQAFGVSLAHAQPPAFSEA
jgi:hypothetical protein